MKLNVEELAREVGFEVHPAKKQIRVGIDCLTGIDSTAKLEAFARLIVERCAVVCEDIELPPGIDMTGAMPSSAWESGTIYAATAIRNLISQK